jgi:hypothetical protein
VPDPSDSNPVVRLSKWAGAISGIVGALAVLVTGIWQVGALLNDLKATRAELASLEGSFSSYKDEMKRRDEIQSEILVNLRIAVASVQAAATTRTPTRTPVGSAVRASVPVVRRRPPPHPTTVTTASTPDVAVLIRSLPAFPPPTPLALAPPSAISAEVQDAVVARETETANVALRRAAILQDQL